METQLLFRRMKKVGILGALTAQAFQPLLSVNKEEVAATGVAAAATGVATGAATGVATGVATGAATAAAPAAATSPATIPVVVLGGSKSQGLALNISQKLSLPLAERTIKKFADGETSVVIDTDVKGKVVYLIQSTSPPANDSLVELLLTSSAVKRAGARKVILIIPYLAYARQDRTNGRQAPISAAVIANCIATCGADRVVCVDLHAGQIEGFFGPHFPVEHLSAAKSMLAHFARLDLQRPMVISPDAGGLHRAKQFQEGLVQLGLSDVDVANINKERKVANQVESMDLAADVKGRDIIIIDDIIDTAGTLCEAANLLKERGAGRIYAFATHGLFSEPAFTRIEKAPFERIFVTDSIPLPPNSPSKIKQFRLTNLLVESILKHDF